MNGNLGSMPSLPTTELATWLNEMLGPSLISYIAGLSDKTWALDWARGVSEPDPRALVRLKMTYRVLQMVLASDDADTMRCWFIGMNPRLDDQSPAGALADGKFQQVLSAAWYMAEQGY